jgi:PadR family transcriptional regulator, regulatory protein PadR
MDRSTSQTQAVLVAFLSNPSSERYGLEIVKETGLMGGTVYPILARLEQRGWVESRWEDINPAVEGRRQRRYYRLTGEGQQAASETLRRTYDRLAPILAPKLSFET